MASSHVESIDVANVLETRMSERLFDSAKISFHFFARRRLVLWRVRIPLVSSVQIGTDLFELFFNLFDLLDIPGARKEEHNFRLSLLQDLQT